MAVFAETHRSVRLLTEQEGAVATEPTFRHKIGRASLGEGW